jgi:membrane protease YdiL (CAAX protease family)
LATQKSLASTKPLPRSTPADSWRWMRLDASLRAIPLLVVPLLVAWLFHLPLASLGLPALSWQQIAWQVGLGLAIGLPFGLLTAIYRAIIWPRVRLPTLSDHTLQSAYYLFLNAPAEELFNRGLILWLVAHWSGSLLLGGLVSTVTYALYHRLGGWSWASVAGVGVAGALFTALYLLQPAPRSILLPVVVHGITTCAFLNMGELAAYARQRWSARRAM